MAKSASKMDSDVHRLTLRLTQKDFERLDYWANRAEMSINEFVVELLDRYIDIENGNYDLPTLEVKRLNQLIDEQHTVSRDIQSLISIVTSGFDSLLSLTRGDNYLLEEEDGEL